MASGNIKKKDVDNKAPAAKHCAISLALMREEEEEEEKKKEEEEVKINLISYLLFSSSLLHNSTAPASPTLVSPSKYNSIKLLFPPPKFNAVPIAAQPCAPMLLRLCKRRV